MKKLFLSCILASLGSAFACTTFASFNGVDNSLVMAKNRDNRPDRQVIAIVVEPSKYKYLALTRQDNLDFVSAGVNEKNLAVFNEVTVEYSALAKGGIADDFSKDILQNYSSAKAVIPDIPKLIAKYPDPVFYQVADGKYLLSIEVAPNHKYSYTLVDKGIFAHTNNYLSKKLIAEYPYTTSEKSRLQASITRLDRARLLLSQQESSAKLDNFQQIALDHHAGYNDSILRSGESDNPKSVRSLAFFAVELPKAERGNVMVQINLYNVGEKYSWVGFKQKDWDKYESTTIVLPNVR